ncbi:hypothetical protein GCM10011405_09130 [Rufibacter glacialis]|nr:hypothetical protein GCM10011405_09130 [Rufibacter glacialis]
MVTGVDTRRTSGHYEVFDVLDMVVGPGTTTMSWISCFGLVDEYTNKQSQAEAKVSGKVDL